ncbi:MAG: ion transporter [Flavobacteriales bacterium]|jgi:voltage-gated potassium channel|nr:ion transporter [Flavobacteriales bacterium]MCI1754251.1 ion transporter [Flavobacteriales bacterium]
MEKHLENSPLRKRLYRIVFGTTTPAGKLFDVLLLWAILISVLLVMLESVPAIKAKYGTALYVSELVFTGIFTVEYFLRLWIVQRPRHYAFSFFGIVDLLSILPTFLSLVIGGAHSLMVIRVLRLVRVFRVLKLARFITEAGMLGRALVASRRKIMVFLLAVLTIVVIFGTIMYLVESPESGFTSIPRSVYWTIVTLTTVGYGDIAPQTTLGQMIASMIMILGYAIIAVPTGIVGVELAKGSNPGKECMTCHATGHLGDARYCRRCGAEMPE